MGIDTNFGFEHEQSPARAAIAAANVDRLGLLRPFVGPPGPPDRNGKRPNAKRSWVGTGFNLLWRPNVVGDFGPKDFFLQLNLTSEELDFTDITGSGIANRSLTETGIRLGGAAYTQAVKDSFDGSDQHFEPGVWANVPQTTAPAEPATVARMGSIPHGSTINLQGIAFEIGNQPPKFAQASITPFKIGSPDDGATDLSNAFDAEQDLNTPSPSRTDRNRILALRPEQLRNPNLFLSEIAGVQQFKKTTVLILSSQAPDSGVAGPPPLKGPNAGGGTANIAFLGTPPAGGPNANAFAPKVTTTFWIEELVDGTLQLQYTQRVLLNFRGLSWPHISVATLTLAPPGRR